MKKKWIGIALCLVLVFTFAGCGGSDSEGAYEAGTYTATADGHNGEVTVEVEFDESSIVRVDVLEHSESDGISDPAIEKIPAGVVEHQSLAVDSVSGATVTSEALKAAIEDCVTQAGG
ncbi:MAG TPA: FAD-binding dehydrogenase, partial [Eubacteriaceae bacterium]|nr:FAD-binding dehydrogenase [Eubacteriaceae bacterium]